MRQDEDYDIQTSEVCRCGQRWGEHETTHSLENIKDKCVVCNYPIMDQNDRVYKERGNYCRTCNGKAEREAKVRGKNSVSLIDLISKK